MLRASSPSVEHAKDYTKRTFGSIRATGTMLHAVLSGYETARQWTDYTGRDFTADCLRKVVYTHGEKTKAVVLAVGINRWVQLTGELEDVSTTFRLVRDLCVAD
jgi:hypothetical protein